MSKRKIIFLITILTFLMSFYSTPTNAYELKKINGNVGRDGSLTVDADYSLNWIDNILIFIHVSSISGYIQKNLPVLGTVDIISATEDHAKLKIYNYATVQDNIYYTNGTSWDKNVDELIIIFPDGYKYQKSGTSILPMFQHTTKIAETKVSYDINAGSSTPKNWEPIVLSNIKAEIAEKFANTIFDKYYWVNIQNSAQSRFSDDFINGLADPLDMLASSSGVNTYSDAATAIKAIATTVVVIKASDYVQVFQLCRSSTAGYDFNAEFNQLAIQIRNDEDVSGKAREIKGNLIELKNDIDQCSPTLMASDAKNIKDTLKNAIDGVIEYLDGLTES